MFPHEIQPIFSYRFTIPYRHTIADQLISQSPDFICRNVYFTDAQDVLSLKRLSRGFG